MTERKDIGLIGSIGVIAGLGLIISAIIVFFANFVVKINRDFWGNVTGYSYSYPNMPYSVILGVLGFVLFIVGAACIRAAKKKG